MKKFCNEYLTAHNLRIFAFVTMTINHFGTLLCNRFNAYGSFAYRLQVFVSRPAFAIFCFFLAEGMIYTHDRKKYLGRILLLAVVSEFFYDFALLRTVPDWRGQNVCFTLFLGGLIIYFNDLCENAVNNKSLRLVIQIFITLFFSYLASISVADYGFMGIALILEFYYLRKNRVAMLIMVALSIPLLWGLQIYCYYDFAIGLDGIIRQACVELPGVLVLPFLYFYNGNMGKKMPKWLIYGFYPGHLALAGLIFKVILH